MCGSAVVWDAYAKANVFKIGQSGETMSTAGIATLKAHLAINVRNVESSIEFYQKMFGIAPSKVRKRYAKFDVQNPPLNFTLNTVPFTNAGALSHMGIQVASTDEVEAMREIGIDISQQKSKEVEEVLGTNPAYVVTVCDNAKEKCPLFPGSFKSVHWDLQDPAGAEGGQEEKLAVFRRVRDEIVTRI